MGILFCEIPVSIQSPNFLPTILSSQRKVCQSDCDGDSVAAATAADTADDAIAVADDDDDDAVEKRFRPKSVFPKLDFFPFSLRVSFVFRCVFFALGASFEFGYVFFCEKSRLFIHIGRFMLNFKLRPVFIKLFGIRCVALYLFHPFSSPTYFFSFCSPNTITSSCHHVIESSSLLFLFLFNSASVFFCFRFRPRI